MRLRDAPLLGGALAALLLSSAAPANKIDPDTGFVMDPRLPLVKANCTACHSASLVTQMRGSRDTWESLIRWMQTTQNLWSFPPATEDAILGYLAEHYAPTPFVGRRPPLDPSLLPPP